MENKEQLPWDLIEEILSRVPPKSLVRFRIVSKQWNRLFNDKTFLNNHKTTFRFILRTKSKIYAVSINLKIELRELTFDIPGLEYNKLVDCNGLLLCGMGNGGGVWNPWLGQTRWIENEVNQPNLQFFGIGYDNDNRYKTLACHRTELDPTKTIWKIYDFSSHSWKNLGLEYGASSSSSKKVRRPSLLNNRGVSLDGSWYGAASNDAIDTSLFFLVMFDFSSELFYIFCDLPCGGNTGHDALALGVFRGHRFSFLKQCHQTKKIEVWVTKNKIDKYRGQDVEWVSFMEASVPDLPDLVEVASYSQPSYVIEDKRLVVCSRDEKGRAWIYVLGDNKLIRKNQIELVVDPWLLHCSLIPSLAPVPRGQREEAKSQV